MSNAEQCQSEQKHLNLLESISDYVMVLTLEGLILDVNQYFLTATRMRREEVVDLPITEMPWWSSVPSARQQLCAAIEQAGRGVIVRFETRIQAHEKDLMDFAVTLTPHRNASGQVEYLIYAALDITAHKRAEAEIRTLIDTLPQFVWIGQPGGAKEYFNQRWFDYTCATPEQMRGMGWLQFLHPDDYEQTRVTGRHALETGELFEIENRFREGRTGTYRWFLSRALPVRDESGQIVRWFGTCTDIEHQKQNEQQLKVSEENWRVLAEAVPQIVWMTRPDGQNEYKNKRWYDYIGEAGQSGIWDHLPFIHPDDRASSQARWQHALDTGTMYEHEERLRNGWTGTYHWFLARGAPVRDETGKVVKWFGTLTDIEEQKRIEAALRQSQERVNILMNSSIIGITVTEGDQIIEANDTFLRMTGYTREDLQQGRLNIVYMTSPEDQARTRQVQQALASGQSMAPFEKTYLCKDGSRLPVVVGRVLLQQEPFQGIGFVLDNSARKELEQRKDTFISMAGHELKTPLAALKLQTQLLEKYLARQGIQVAPAALAKIETQINRVTRLVEELLDVSKIQAGKLEYIWESVDLHALLRSVVVIMHQAYPTHAIILRGKMPALLIGDRDRLEQVFTNLLSNAIKYSPQAKTVEVNLSVSEKTAVVRVCDHGLGIPREQCDKIFERFYRVTDLKQKSIPGLGIGLSIAAEIVRHHGGVITVESAVGKGSTFTVTLPLCSTINQSNFSGS